MGVLTGFRIDEIEHDQVSVQSAQTQIRFSFLDSSLCIHLRFNLAIHIADAYDDMPVIHRRPGGFHAYIGRNVIDEQAIAKDECPMLLDFAQQLFLVERILETALIFFVNEGIRVLFRKPYSMYSSVSAST